MPDETTVAESAIAADTTVAVAELAAQAEVQTAAIEAEAQVATAQLIHERVADETLSIVALNALATRVESLERQVAGELARLGKAEERQADEIEALVEEVEDLAERVEEPPEAPSPIETTPKPPEEPTQPQITPRPTIRTLSPRDQRLLRRRHKR